MENYIDADIVTPPIGENIDTCIYNIIYEKIASSDYFLKEAYRNISGYIDKNKFFCVPYGFFHKKYIYKWKNT